MKLFDRTEQQMFDEVVEHARKQGRRSEAGYCKYRGPSGLKCFIGALISDSDYLQEMEGNTMLELTRIDASRLGESSQNKISLAIDLQKTHDGTPEYLWEDKFLTIAKKYNLIYTPQDTNNEIA